MPSIQITCDTESSKIYYTLNGEDPSSNSTLYNSPFEVNEVCTIKAIGMKEEWVESSISLKEITQDMIGPALPVINFNNDPDVLGFTLENVEDYKDTDKIKFILYNKDGADTTTFLDYEALVEISKLKQNNNLIIDKSTAVPLVRPYGPFASYAEFCIVRNNIEYERVRYDLREHNFKLNDPVIEVDNQMAISRVHISSYNWLVPKIIYTNTGSTMVSGGTDTQDENPFIFSYIVSSSNYTGTFTCHFEEDSEDPHFLPSNEVSADWKSMEP